MPLPLLTAAPGPALRTRGLVLVGLLGLELLAMTASFSRPALLEDSRWSAYGVAHSHVLWQLGLWVTGSWALLLLPRLKAIVSLLADLPTDYPWSAWLGGQALVFTALLVITAGMFTLPPNPARLSPGWVMVWLAMVGATGLLGLLTVAAGGAWWRLVRQEHPRLLLGALLGVAAWRLIRFEGPFAQEAPWTWLAEPTLRLVHWLLGWGYADLVYQPERFVVGTAAFPVYISYVCSGYEGMILITLFLAIYCALFRKHLRFPRAWWLFPIGVAVVWLTNAVRIAGLIAIGTSFSPAVALHGFHAQAGWIAFTLIAVGVMALSHRSGFFTPRPAHAPVRRTGPPWAAALLMPLLALQATAMVTAAFSAGFEGLYPLRVVATAAVLYAFRTAYRGLDWQGSWPAAAIGAAVFVLWMLVTPADHSRDHAVSQALANLAPAAAAVWVAFRLVGAVLLAPVAEELAFRGYLLRKLIANDIGAVPPGQFTGLSFLLTSVLFGVLHGSWLAGTLAGMGYALALYRRGHLGDAVVAHVTTNALIALAVLIQGRWSLWS